MISSTRYVSVLLAYSRQCSSFMVRRRIQGGASTLTVVTRYAAAARCSGSVWQMTCFPQVIGVDTGAHPCASGA